MRKGVAETHAVASPPVRPRPSEASRHQPGWRPPLGDMEWGPATVHFGATPKPETERRILEEVGSYGRQIGWIMEAMEVLIEALEADHNGPLSRDRLDEAELTKLAKFARFMKAVEAAKQG